MLSQKTDGKQEIIHKKNLVFCLFPAILFNFIDDLIQLQLQESGYGNRKKHTEKTADGASTDEGGNHQKWMNGHVIT